MVDETGPQGLGAPTRPAPVEGGEAVTFMSYNMTGADTVKCQWVRDIAFEQEANFIALQEHFKTVKSNDQCFKKQFSKYHTYVTPAYRLSGVDSGRGIGGVVQLAGKGLAVN